MRAALKTDGDLNLNRRSFLRASASATGGLLVLLYVDLHALAQDASRRDRIARFIDGAKHTLFMQNERYQDSMIIEHLVRAARRGVKVHVMSPPPHKLDKTKRVEGVGGLQIMDDVKIGIRRLKGLKLHGKMLLADGDAAIIGSLNLTPGFDTRREAAIEVSDDHVIKRLHKIVHHDWKHAHPLDLSDDGLMADLHDSDEARRLGIHVKKE